VAILVAIGVNQDGFREVLGLLRVKKRISPGGVLSVISDRCLKCPRLFISDKCMGLIESLSQFYPEGNGSVAVHFYRNVFGVAPKESQRRAAMLKAIHAQENKEEAIAKSKIVADKLKQMKLPKAAEMVSLGILETLTHMDFIGALAKDQNHNPLENHAEIRRAPVVEISRRRIGLDAGRCSPSIYLYNKMGVKKIPESCSVRRA
jgi:transposase-like protein